MEHEQLKQVPRISNGCVTKKLSFLLLSTTLRLGLCRLGTSVWVPCFLCHELFTLLRIPVIQETPRSRKVDLIIPNDSGAGGRPT